MAAPFSIKIIPAVANDPRLLFSYVNPTKKAVEYSSTAFYLYIEMI
jgi:hypothetical protein